MLSSQCLPCVKGGGFCRRQKTEGLSHAPYSRNGYWSHALFFCVGPCGAVLLARPKVPKSRTGVSPVPRHPEPHTATLDCSITEHCQVPGRGANRGGPQAPFSVILSIAKDLPKPAVFFQNAGDSSACGLRMPANIVIPSPHPVIPSEVEGSQGVLTLRSSRRLRSSG